MIPIWAENQTHIILTTGCRCEQFRCFLDCCDPCPRLNSSAPPPSLPLSLLVPSAIDISMPSASQRNSPVLFFFPIQHAEDQRRALHGSKNKDPNAFPILIRSEFLLKWQNQPRAPRGYAVPTQNRSDYLFCFRYKTRLFPRLYSPELVPPTRNTSLVVFSFVISLAVQLDACIHCVVGYTMHCGSESPQNAPMIAYVLGDFWGIVGPFGAF